MNIVLLGGPGSGKGTVSNLFEQTQNMGHIATGDMFREEIKNGTELGRKAQEYIDKGNLVPDEITINMLKGKINQFKDSNGEDVNLDQIDLRDFSAKSFGMFLELDTHALDINTGRKYMFKEGLLQVLSNGEYVPVYEVMSAKEITELFMYLSTQKYTIFQLKSIPL